MHHARVVPLSGLLALESETSMAAKCAYVEKVGAVYYVRKRIPRAWNRQAEGEVVRMSLRTKNRVTALKRCLEALAVFEELLGMEPKAALMQLTRQLVDEQLLQPEDMTGADMVRRRALGNVGAKIIGRAREELGPMARDCRISSCGSPATMGRSAAAVTSPACRTVR